MYAELNLRQLETFWVQLTSDSNFVFLSEEEASGVTRKKHPSYVKQ